MTRLSRFLRSPESRISDRFWSKVDASGDCWEWIGRQDKHGYGEFDFQRRPHRAHRISYTLLMGEVPSGMELDHLCRNPRCVNPDHLEPVTHRENSLRGYSMVATNARRATCRLGHPLLQGPRQRWCRTCLNDRQRRQYRSKVEASRRGMTTVLGSTPPSTPTVGATRATAFKSAPGVAA